MVFFRMVKSHMYCTKTIVFERLLMMNCSKHLLAHCFWDRSGRRTVRSFWSGESLYPIRDGVWGEGGGEAESARADFYFRELPCYLSNSYETLPLLPKSIGEQDSGIFFFFFCQRYNLFPWQPDFRRYV